MKAARIVFVPIVAALILTVIGCDENARLAEMAERHLDRQAEQNRQMAELHRQVADGSRELVAADAKAPKNSRPYNARFRRSGRRPAANAMNSRRSEGRWPRSAARIPLSLPRSPASVWSWHACYPCSWVGTYFAPQPMTPIASLPRY